MALRLRGNANACNRSAEQNRRALEKSRANPANSASPSHVPPADPDEHPTDEALAGGLAAAQELADAVQARTRDGQPAVRQTPQPLPMTVPQRSQAWATAMIDAAGKINATLGTLPPDQRRSASLRAATLTTTATGLLGGMAAPSLQSTLHALPS